MNPILKRGIVNIVEDGVFDNINSIHDLNNTIVEYGNKFKNSIVNNKLFNSNTKFIESIFEHQYNHNVGLAFEVFVACLFEIRGTSFDMLYCKDYCPSDTTEQDMGVDAYAVSIDPDKVTSGKTKIAVQIKFSRDGNFCYGNTNLKNFGQVALNRGVTYDNMIFVNYGSGVSSQTQEMYSDGDRSMRVISRKDIISLLAKPGTFFDDMRELLKLSYEHVIDLNTEESLTSKSWKIRSFQKEVIDDAKKIIDSKDVNKKTYIMPTGSGKTLTAMKIIDHAISKSRNASFIVVCVPTILLSSQYSKDIVEYYGRNMEVMRVCSDKERDIHSVKEDITLNPTDIIARIMSSSMSKKNTVIITTYASYEKVFSSFAKIDVTVDLCIMDEAHHIVAGSNSVHSESNWKTRMKIEDKKLYNNLFNFTATPYFDKTLVDDNGKILDSSKFPVGRFSTASMNNPMYFGNMLSIPLTSVLNEGYITPVKLWALKIGNDFDKITISTVKCIIDKHCDKMDRMNVHNGNVMIRPSPEEVMSHLYSMNYLYQKNNGQYVKLICSTPSTGYAHVLNHVVREIIPMLAEAGYDFFKDEIYVDSMSSDIKHMKHWSIMKKRDDIINEIKKDTHSLVYHYDMMSEGVNIPCISGVIIARSMCETKAVQVIGRAVRPTLNDINLNNIAHAENDPYRYSPTNMDNRLKDLEKPVALCIVPVFGNCSEVKNQLDHFISKLYEGNSEYAFSGVMYTDAGSVEDDEDRTLSDKEVLSFMADNVKHLPSFSIDENDYTIKTGTVDRVDEIANSILLESAPELLTSSSGSKTLVYIDVAKYNLTSVDEMFTIVEKIMENDKICASVTKKDGVHKFIISYR